MRASNGIKRTWTAEAVEKYRAVGIYYADLSRHQDVVRIAS